ncbi:MAG TPA: ATP-binding protein [Thermoanaerobaculia bacterium]|nr:ATP-binding protein [Thermoanaerobaculia bacterium]
MRLSTRIILAIAYAALTSAAAMYVAMRLNRDAAWIIATAVILGTIAWCAHMIVSRVMELHAVLGNALAAFRDGDFSLRLTAHGDREIADLKTLYNELADKVRTGRQDIHQKEILLDTILQRTPVAVMLLNPAQRVIFSNAAARELLGGRLDGRLLDELLPNLAAPLREALAGQDDTIFRVDVETFHLTQRVFRLNTQEHHLVLIERLTPELRRQEVEVWKRAIRIINHEINNTVAPISSLFHSARLAQERPQHQHRLGEIYGLIEERLVHLRAFLEGYAQFARLPQPKKERTEWSAILDDVRTLYPFATEGTPALTSNIDRGQFQQVLINLVKNAREAGSEDVTVSVQQAGSDCVVQVMDRGRGMSEEVMRQALVPFFTTKPDGSGLGLALSNEIVEAHGGRMRLGPREGGGTVVTLWIP